MISPAAASVGAGVDGVSAVVWAGSGVLVGSGVEVVCA
jgi:hypothetical protein